MTKANSAADLSITESLVQIAIGLPRQLTLRHLVCTTEEYAVAHKMSPALEQSYRMSKEDLKTRRDASTAEIQGLMPRIDACQSNPTLHYYCYAADIASRLSYLARNGLAKMDAAAGSWLFKLQEGSADMQVLDALVMALEKAASGYDTLIKASHTYVSVEVWMAAIQAHYQSYETKFVDKHTGDNSLKDSATAGITYAESMYNGVRIQHVQELLQVNLVINNLRELEEEIVRRLLNRSFDKTCPKLQWLVVECITAMRKELENELKLGWKSARNDIRLLLLDDKPSFRQLRAVARDSALHDANPTVHWLLHRGH